MKQLRTEEGSKLPLVQRSAELTAPSLEVVVEDARKQQERIASDSSRGEGLGTMSITYQPPRGFIDTVKELRKSGSGTGKDDLPSRVLSAPDMQFLTKQAYYELLRAPKMDEKMCHLGATNDCYGARLVKQHSKQPVRGLVAVSKGRPLKKQYIDGGVSYCVACLVAGSHKASLQMLHSGQPRVLSGGYNTAFEQNIRVHCSAIPSDSSFQETEVWTAPFVYNSRTKEGSHFGTVCHMPLLIANLRNDNGRLVPPGYKYEDNLLVRQSTNEGGNQNLPTRFFS